MIDFYDVQQASKTIQNHINQTPVMTSRTLNKLLSAEVFVKCENFQRGGAFKFRGTCNKLLSLSQEEKEKGVITHSSGNHAQAVALACQLLGIKAVIVMPENAPQIKVVATKEYGAEIQFCKNTVEDRQNMCQKLQKQYGYTLVHPYDDDAIIAGAGTACLELINSVGDLDYLFCPVGGGGLLSGSSITAKALSPRCTVIGVEPALADDAYRSFKQGQLYPSMYPNTIADGLRTALSLRTFEIIRTFVDDIITVTEEEIIQAMQFYWTRMKLVVEPSGAVALAGACTMKKQLQQKKVGVLISGGNVEVESYFSNYYQLLKT